MNPGLQHLLDLRREAEKNAEEALAAVRAARLAKEEEQARLEARWEAACSSLAKEGRRQATRPSPMTAGQAAAGAAYLGRLRDRAADLGDVVETHRATVLASAKTAEDAAQAAHEEARHAREAVEKHMAREEGRQRQIAERQAEEAAGDLAQAAFVRRGKK